MDETAPKPARSDGLNLPAPVSQDMTELLLDAIEPGEKLAIMEPFIVGRHDTPPAARDAH